jgi:subtilase family serine protease
MRGSKNVAAGLFFGLLTICACLLWNVTPARAAGETCSTGSASPCAEDIEMSSCNICHSIRVTAGNRNGTNRVITGASGTVRHIDDPKISDWTSIVSAMISKGSPAVLNLTAGYLNTNYCSTCTGPILGSPLQSSVTSSGAIVTWSTSYSGWEDELTDTVLFYGTTEADVLACTNTAGCPGVTAVVQDGGTPVAHHVINLTGLSSSTKYFMVNQATSASHGMTRSLYAVSFRTKPGPSGGAVPARLYVSEDESSASGTENDRIVVIDPNPLKPDNTPNPAYNTQIGNVTVTGKDPADMAAHPDGTTVYAMVGSNLSVITIDPVTFVSAEFASLLGAGDIFNYLAVSPDGKNLYLAYRVSSGTATLKIKVYDVTDPSTPTLTTTISDPLFDGCYGALGLGISPDGSQLYLACRPTNSSLPDNFYMVDTSSNAVTLTTTFARDSSNTTTINALVVTPDGSKIYLARSVSGSGSTVEIFDGATGSNIGSIPLPASALPRAGVISLDGGTLYVVDVGLGIHVIDTSSDTYLLTMAQTKSRGFDIGLTPDGTRLYTTLLGSVFVNDTATNTWLTTITGDYNSAMNLAIAPGRSGTPTPDVVMTDVTPNAAGAPAGSTLPVTDTVKNQGTASTDSSFFIGYSLSPNGVFGDGDDVVITTTRVVGPLGAGVTDTADTNLLIPSTTPPGTYHICALADSTSALSESNVDNNSLCSTATIQVAQPDLVMTAVTPNASSFVAGGTLSVTDTMQNQGAAPTLTSVSIGYSLSTDSVYGNGDDVPITTTRVVGLLAAGGISTATTNLLIPSSTPSGIYHVCANADSSNAVSESNESNNSLCSTATVSTAITDLIMSAVSTTATAAAPGGTVSLSNTAKNTGSVPAGSFTIAYHLSPTANYDDPSAVVSTTIRTVTSLAAGASSAATTSVAVPSATPLGTYYVCAKADSGNTVLEGDETNNTRCTTGTIQVTRPDLIMTAVTPNAATVSATGTLSVTNSMKNQGAVAAGSSKVGFDLSPTANYNDPGAVAIATTRTVSTLAAGATNTATTTLTIPNTTSPGNYYVCAVADMANTVVELDETNNTSCSTSTVIVPGADLIMTAVSTTATFIAPGKTFTLPNTVKNQGLFPASSFTIGFDLSPSANYNDPGAVAIVTTRSVTSLASGASNSATSTLTIPSTTPFGTYYVCAMADSGNTVMEGDETNNTLCTSTTVQVSDPDLIMTAVSTTATTVLKGKTFSASSTVHNQGPLASGAFRIAFHLSPNTTYGDSDDVVITAIRSVTSLAAGANSTGSTTLTVPTATPSGTYYVCTMADSLNQVTELDETNNTLCSTTQITVP